jgi:hypothetical protein
MEEKKQKKSKESELQEKWDKATPIYYARFHQSVPPGKDKEPVAEFSIKNKNPKYIVDELRWSWGDGVLFKAYGEIDMSPEANVQYVRFTL